MLEAKFSATELIMVLGNQDELILPESIENTGRNDQKS